MLQIKHSKLGWAVLCVLSFSLVIFSCEEEPEPGPTLYEIVSTLPDASTYIEAIDLAEFDDDLSSGQALTLFIPTNSAFDAFLSQNSFGSLSDIPIEDLRDLLRYHIIPAGVELSAATNNYTLSAADNGPDGNLLAMFIQNEGSGSPTKINRTTQVLSEDNPVDNSFYNTIDEVLTIPTLLSTLQDNDAFDLFAAGISQAQGLADSLENNGPYTVLVATDATVETAVSDRYGISDLVSLEQMQLDSLMSYHIVKGNQVSLDLQNAINFEYETLIPDLNLRISGFSSLIVNDSSSVVLANIQTSNGVIHVVDNLLNYK